MPGQHPAFGPVTRKEIKEAQKAQAEAVRLYEGMGRSVMTAVQKWHAHAVSRENLHRKNLEMFLSARPKAVGGAKRKAAQIQLHRYGLVCALRDLGRFQEALEVASNAKGKSRAGLKILADQVMEWGMAVAREDTHEHHCERTSYQQAVKDERGKQREVKVELPRRHKVAQVFSPRHGKVVDIWRCSQCGYLNAHDLGPPDHQAEALRLRELVANGKAVPCPEMRDDVLFRT